MNRIYDVSELKVKYIFVGKEPAYYGVLCKEKGLEYSVCDNFGEIREESEEFPKLNIIFTSENEKSDLIQKSDNFTLIVNITDEIFPKNSKNNVNSVRIAKSQIPAFMEFFQKITSEGFVNIELSDLKNILFSRRILDFSDAGNTNFHECCKSLKNDMESKLQSLKGKKCLINFSVSYKVKPEEILRYTEELRSLFCKDADIFLCMQIEHMEICKFSALYY